MAALIKVYMQDPFLKAMQADISAVLKDEHGWFVRLNNTIFHPKGGGQLDDRGTINNIHVTAVIKAGDQEINHYLEIADNPDLEIGQKVELKIDQARRLQNTALHSAGHVLAALVEEHFPQYKAFQAHHYPNEANVKFNFDPEKGIHPDYHEMQTIINRVFKQTIARGLPIISHITPEGRQIQVGYFTPVGCGGTHLMDVNQLANAVVNKIVFKKDILKVSYTADIAPHLQMHE